MTFQVSAYPVGTRLTLRALDWPFADAWRASTGIDLQTHPVQALVDQVIDSRVYLRLCPHLVPDPERNQFYVAMEELSAQTFICSRQYSRCHVCSSGVVMFAAAELARSRRLPDEVCNNIMKYISCNVLDDGECEF